jgi:hypothetical protein
MAQQDKEFSYRRYECKDLERRQIWLVASVYDPTQPLIPLRANTAGPDAMQSSMIPLDKSQTLFVRVRILGKKN